MLKTRWQLILVPLLAVLFFAGCSDDDDTTSPPVDTGLTPAAQFEAMVDAGIDYINGDAPSTVSAVALNENRDDYTVIDIRGQVDYDAGHIEGAIHTSLGTLESDLDAGKFPTTLPIVVACYTGQTAGHAVVALRMWGYDASILLFGMSSWNSTLDRWSGNCTDGLPAGSIETAPNALTTAVDWPVWDTDATSAGEVVEARVSQMLSNGFKAISVADMVANGIDEYFILNYFGPADYAGTGTSGIPGHIEGAYQYTPYASLDMDEQLKYLPTDKQIVVYCWTGQHASQVTAYLNMLGYDALSLKFSSNGLWYSGMTAHKWSPGAMNDFALVTTP